MSAGCLAGAEGADSVRHQAGLLAGIDQRLAYETKMTVYVAEDPMTCVVRGAGKVLEEMETLRKVLVTDHTRPLRQ